MVNGNGDELVVVHMGTVLLPFILTGQSKTAVYLFLNTSQASGLCALLLIQKVLTVAMDIQCVKKATNILFITKNISSVYI